VIWPLARTRLALGVAPAVVPVTFSLALGVVLGPQVTNVLSADVLAHLDAVVSVALGTLGIFMGLAALPHIRGAAPMLRAACIESGITTALVAGAIALLLVAWTAPLSTGVMVLALTLGAAAAASGAGTGAESAGDEHAARIADLDDLLPVVVAAAALALGAAPSRTAPLLGIVLPAALGCAIGLIGWLLFERSDGPGERAVFVIGIVAMLGGAASYLQVSPMVSGIAAGAFWTALPGHADRLIAGDLRKFHHPLIVLLVVTAGAQLVVTPLAVWLFAPLVVFRLTGKVLGGIVAARLEPALAGEMLGVYLVSPGVIGIAIALNFQQVLPVDAPGLLSAVAASAALFEVLTPLVAARGSAA
jgi:hypothetical protein